MISIPSKNEEDGSTSFGTAKNPGIPELQLPRGKLQGSIGMTRMTPSMASCTSGEGHLGHLGPNLSEMNTELIGGTHFVRGGCFSAS